MASRESFFYRVALALITALFVGVLLVENASTKRELQHMHTSHQQIEQHHKETVAFMAKANLPDIHVDDDEKKDSKRAAQEAADALAAAKAASMAPPPTDSNDLVQNLRHEASADADTFETVFPESNPIIYATVMEEPTLVPAPSAAPVAGPFDPEDDLPLRFDPFPGDHDGSTMHIVFSMACDQQHRLLYATVMQESAMRAGQKGPMTMIVSGCKEEYKALLLAEPRFYYDFRVHFTPMYTPHPEPDVDDAYTPYNKPYALRHFLQNANPPIQHDIITLVDGDFVFFKPLEVNTGRNMTKYYKGTRDPSTVTDTVKDGVAIAHDWRNVIRGDKYFSTDKHVTVCGSQPCGKTSEEDGWEYYWGVGPPYIMTKNDMTAFVDDYCKFTVESRKVSKDWMTEMYGYSLAVANHGIKHTIFSHLGISHPYLRDSNEYWSFLDGDKSTGESELKENPCEHPTRIPLPRDPPVGLHYFHLLYSGDAYFYKKKIPDRFLECSHELLKVPGPHEWEITSALDRTEHDRTYKRHEIWGSCALHKAINRGALLLKKVFCSQSGYNAFQGFQILKDKQTTNAFTCSMKPPPPARVHLTRDQQRALYQHHQDNPLVSLYELGQWARARFALQRAPAASNVCELLKRFHQQPALLDDDTLDLPACQASTLLDAKLSERIERLKAERVCDEIVAGGVSASTRERLELLTFSKGWLYNSQRRFKLRSRRMHGEAGSVSSESIETGRARLRGITVAFGVKDGFNVDETALYYCKAPATTISREPVSGSKLSKKRITVAAAANADGSEKLSLLFVGSARQPRCFGRLTGEQLGVNYTSSSKAWMDRALFKSWIEELNKRMKSEGRRILLLLDNASAHQVSEPLSNIEIQMLPPNTTSVLQPMDAGGIAALKAWFRRRQGRHVVETADEIVSATGEGSRAAELYNADVLQAMRWYQDAWESVTQSTIANCWTHTGILPEDIYGLINGIANVRLE